MTGKNAKPKDGMRKKTVSHAVRFTTCITGKLITIGEQVTE